MRPAPTRALAAAILLAALPAPASAGAGTPTDDAHRAGASLSELRPAPTRAQGGDRRRRPPPSRVHIDPPAGGSILVHATYPRIPSSCVDPAQPILHARYPAALDVIRESGGSLMLVAELPFERYLRGIAEVPRSWPMAALKAQVVAARSYAMAQLARGGAEAYDLCATDACQVYLGMRVEAGLHGRRWIRAVEETEGEVLLHDGRPAETLYFSTSNGRTYSNAEVWGTEPLPYLRGVPERDDLDSPLARWRVTVPFAHLAPLLSEAEVWEGGPVRGVVARRGRIVLLGRGDRRAVLDREGLRDALNATASCLMPDRYPPTKPSGFRLPQTVPSVWYRAGRRGDALVLEGRGWGHGIGMVQWGAKGKAERGLSYADILAAYYGGLRPQRIATPGSIRILIAAGLSSVTVAPSGPATAMVRGRPARAEPPWRITAGRGVRVRRGGRPPPQLSLERFSVGRRRGAPGAPIGARLEASDPVRARLEVVRGGEVRRGGAWASFEDGPIRLRARLPREPGRYGIRARATDGVDTVVTPSRAVTVGGASRPPETRPEAELEPAPAPGGSPAAAPGRPGGVPVLPLAAGAAAVTAAAVLTLLWRRRLHRS